MNKRVSDQVEKIISEVSCIGCRVQLKQGVGIEVQESELNRSYLWGCVCGRENEALAEMRVWTE